MSHPYMHARSSAKKFGGQPSDYQALHDWFDESKKLYANWRHRALRHHAEGIFMAEQIFGLKRQAEEKLDYTPTTIRNSDGREVPIRLIGEQHVKEDLGFIPTMQDWLKHVGHEKWMTRGVEKLDESDLAAA